jgi:hypothetical protein
MAPQDRPWCLQAGRTPWGAPMSGLWSGHGEAGSPAAESLNRATDGQHGELTEQVDARRRVVGSASVYLTL